MRRMRSLFTVAIMASVTLLAAWQPHAAFAQDEEGGETLVTLNLQDVDIRVLINTVAEVSGRNFIVDPRVKGKVSIISGASLNPDELYDVFLSILEVHNFATVDSGTVIKVLPNNV
ncbi:MAG: type II secretion system protein GspD, partial [Pseudomonadota bacterium]